MASGSSDLYNEDGSVKDEYFDRFPIGRRFCPTELELVRHYLIRKIRNQSMPLHKIKTIDLYRYSPEELTKKPNREKKWFYFTKRDKKYQNGDKPNRVVDEGYWKASDTMQPIHINGEIVAYKRKLDFYRGNRDPNDVRTNWKMIEFLAVDETVLYKKGDPRKFCDIVLCVLYKKNESKNKEKFNKNEAKKEEIANKEAEQTAPTPTTSNCVHVISASSSSYENGSQSQSAPLTNHDMACEERQPTGLLDDMFHVHFCRTKRKFGD